ncbi:hypothetical protein DFH08DRAFT_32831 [Mycena albidolilacea]|uniref:Phosphoribosylaminoimidazole-succinocarboxamide synthase n=1 Tax=Mycena albidolilacea TaxID=1033008 RepID=A0AAD7F4X3_9AGAR|nr:hypothetical protein DFH08DRAFT_32831 [Mycena albidolilacea]
MMLFSQMLNPRQRRAFDRNFTLLVRQARAHHPKPFHHSGHRRDACRTHEYKAQLEGRAMLVRKAQVVPLEAIVRGYLTGSAWAEYQKSGTVHGISLPAGLRESERRCSRRPTRPTSALTTRISRCVHPLITLLQFNGNFGRGAHRRRALRPDQHGSARAVHRRLGTRARARAYPRGHQVRVWPRPGLW